MAKLNKITKLALEWHSDGLDNSQVVDNVADTLMYDWLEEVEADLSDRQDARLEMLIKSIVMDNIDWDAIADADKELRAYNEAKFELN